MRSAVCSRVSRLPVVAGGELPGDGCRRGHFDDRVDAEPDRRETVIRAYLVESSEMGGRGGDLLGTRDRFDLEI